MPRPAEAERGHCATHVRVGSIASLWPWAEDFRSNPINRHSQCPSACLKRARLGHAEAALCRHTENGVTSLASCPGDMLMSSCSSLFGGSAHAVGRHPLDL